MPQTQRARVGDVTPPGIRHEPAERKRMSGPALRAFAKIADKWNLDTREQLGLLGWPSKSTLYNWRATPDDVTLPYDVLVRLSLILGIYKALHILYPETDLADGWMRIPNRNPLFGGRTPLEHALVGQDALHDVRRLLDSRRGGWN
jgi:hypothetical protein